jgi:hypothetical protein
MVDPIQADIITHGSKNRGLSYHPTGFQDCFALLPPSSLSQLLQCSVWGRHTPHPKSGLGPTQTPRLGWHTQLIMVLLATLSLAYYVLAY